MISKSMRKRINMMKGLPMDHVSDDERINILEEEIDQLCRLIHRNITKFDMDDREIFAKLVDGLHGRRNIWITEKHKKENLEKYGKEMLR